MNILEVLGILLLGVALGYGFRARIGNEFVTLKQKLAALESKAKSKL